MFAVGKVARHHIATPAQAHEIEDAPCVLMRFCFIGPRCPGVEHGAVPCRFVMDVHADQDVLDRGQVPKQADILIGAIDTGFRDPVGCHAVDALAGEPDGAFLGSVELHDTVEDGRLAGAVRPDDAVDYSFLDFEVEPVHGDDAAEPLGHPLRPQERAVPPVWIRGHALCSATAAAWTAWVSASRRISRRLAADGHKPSGLSRMTAIIASP